MTTRKVRSFAIFLSAGLSLSMGQNVGIGTVTPQARLHLQVPQNWNVPIFRVDRQGSNNPIFLILPSEQVGIGTGSPHPSAALHISDSTRGVLFPALPLDSVSSASPVNNPAQGLLIWNTNSSGEGANFVHPGFYYWDGTRWTRLATSQNSGIIFGRSTTFSHNLTAQPPCWECTGGYIELPPGDWIIYYQDILRPNPYPNCNLWVSVALLPGTCQAGDVMCNANLVSLLGGDVLPDWRADNSIVVSGLFPASGQGPYNQIQGFYLMRNSSGQVRRYSLWGRIYPWGCSYGGSLQNLGLPNAPTWGEVRLFAVPAR